MNLYILLASTFVLAIALGWVARAQKETQFLEYVVKDSEARLMFLTLVGLVAGLVSAIYLVMALIRGNITDAGIAAMVGTVVGMILGSTVSQPWGYWFGSSKGSSDKTRIAAEADKAGEDAQ